MNLSRKLFAMVLTISLLTGQYAYGAQSISISDLEDAPEWAKGTLLMVLPGTDTEVESIEDVYDRYVCSMNLGQRRTTLTKIPANASFVDTNLDNVKAIITPIEYIDREAPVKRWRTFDIELVSLDTLTNRICENTEIKPDGENCFLYLKENPLAWFAVGIHEQGDALSFVISAVYMGYTVDSKNSLANQLLRTRTEPRYEEEGLGDTIRVNGGGVTIASEPPDLSQYHAHVSSKGAVAYVLRYNSEYGIIVIDGDQRHTLSEVCDDRVACFCWETDSSILYFTAKRGSDAMRYNLMRWNLYDKSCEKVLDIEVAKIPGAMAFNQKHNELAVYLCGDEYFNISPDAIMVYSLDTGKRFGYKPWSTLFDDQNRNYYYGMDENGLYLYSPEYLVEPQIMWLNEATEIKEAP